MQTAINATNDEFLSDRISSINASGVSWGAVLAGAAAAAVLSIILFILGFGLGLSVLSPWRQVDGSTFAWTAVAWVAFTQIAASGLGGYIAGRLRVRWVRLHSDEVYFRDTAHGFLAWAVASLLTVAVFASSATAIIDSSAKAGSAIAATGIAAGAASSANNSVADANGGNSIDYYVDGLLRSSVDSTNPAQDAHDREEIIRILTHSLAAAELSPEDKTYVTQLIARRTGLTAQEAEQRVNTIYGQAQAAIEKVKEAADKARKAAAYTSLWMFVALLCGAFVASLSATWGGKQRDAFSSAN